MKYKISLIIVAFFLLLFPFVSASVDFNKDVGEYGEYEIDSFFPTWLGGEGESFVELIENTDQCLIDCHAILKFSNKEPQNLLEDIDFISRSGRDAIGYISELKFSYGNYFDVEKKRKVYSEEICEEVINEGNKSTQTICVQEVIGEESYYENELIWSEYKGEEVLDGLLRIDAKKNLAADVDWIITFRGKVLDEYAWWNSNWNYKRSITNLTGNISYLLINFTPNMKIDFSDIRFIYNDVLELNYTIESYINSTHAQVRLNNLGYLSLIDMYYGEPGASTTSNASDVYFEPISAYYFDVNANDFIGNNDGAVTGATLTDGYINNSYEFNGASDFIDLGTPNLDLSTNFTWNVWFNTDSISSGVQHFISMGRDDNNFPLISFRIDTDVIRGFIRDAGSDAVDCFGTTTLSIDTWYMATLTWDVSTKTCEIFLNATSEATDTNIAVSTQTYNTYHVGKLERIASSDYFNGNLDEIYTYNKVLSQEQINALLNQTAPNVIEGNEIQNVGISTELIFPTDNYISLLEQVNFTVNSISIEGTELNNVTLFVWDKLNNSLVLNQTENIISNTSIITNFNLTLEDGLYLWNAETCGDTENCSFATLNYTLPVHTIPPIINISEPSGTLDFIKLGENETFSWQVTEEDTNLTEHIIECIYEYNGTIFNVTNICLTTNSTNFTYISNDKSLTFNVTDLFGFVTSNTTTWDYEVVQNNLTYNNITTEGSLEEFTLLLDTLNTITNAKFIYNGTAYSTNILNLGGRSNQVTSTISIPLFENDANVTFYFNITTTSISDLKLEDNIQLVRILEVSNCSTFNNSIMNLSLFDERTLGAINGTIEFDFEIMNSVDKSIVSQIFTSFNEVHEVEICSNLNFTSADFLYDLELRYYSGDNITNIFTHVPEFYHIQEASVSNLPQTINLYDLNVNESTEFTIFYRDDDYIARENVLLQMQRKYVDEGLFRVVEIPITSSEGSAVGHFDLNNYKYQIVATENGEVLNVFPNPSVRCESELSGICIINLKGEAETPQAQYTSDVQNFFYTVSEENNSITILYTIPTGESKITNIQMVQTSPFADPVTLCNQTLLASGGQISCQVNDTIGDSQVDIRIVSDSEPKANLIVNFQEEYLSSFALSNYFIAVILLILLITMFVTSPIIMVIVSIFGVIYLGFMFLLKASSVGLVLGAVSWLIVAGIIIISKLAKKEEE